MDLLQHRIRMRLHLLDERPQKFNIQPARALVARRLQPEQQQQLEVVVAREAGRGQSLHSRDAAEAEPIAEPAGALGRPCGIQRLAGGVGRVGQAHGLAANKNVEVDSKRCMDGLSLHALLADFTSR